jgi:hypothetical protein
MQGLARAGMRKERLSIQASVQQRKAGLLLTINDVSLVVALTFNVVQQPPGTPVATRTCCGLDIIADMARS